MPKFSVLANKNRVAVVPYKKPPYTPATSKVLDVSIVIVNWNVTHLLKDCLQSIRQNCEGLNIEVIVVDNASTDESISTLYEEFPWVTFIQNTKNVGFARANNQGFEIAGGEFVFI